MRQEVTRAHKGWALDSVVLHNDVIRAMKEDINSPPSVGFGSIYLLVITSNSWGYFSPDDYDDYDDDYDCHVGLLT